MDLEQVKKLLAEALQLLEADSIPAAEDSPAPSNGEETIFGKVGRPEYAERKGIAIWEAGLKIQDDDGRWKWINIQAWRKTAVFARDYLPSAAETTAVGKWKSESWAGNDGEERSREVFVVTHFVANESGPPKH